MGIIEFYKTHMKPLTSNKKEEIFSGVWYDQFRRK